MKKDTETYKVEQQNIDESRQLHERTVKLLEDFCKLNFGKDAYISTNVSLNRYDKQKADGSFISCGKNSGNKVELHGFTVHFNKDEYKEHCDNSPTFTVGDKDVSDNVAVSTPKK